MVSTCWLLLLVGDQVLLLLVGDQVLLLLLVGDQVQWILVPGAQVCWMLLLGPRVGWGRHRGHHWREFVQNVVAGARVFHGGGGGGQYHHILGAFSWDFHLRRPEKILVIHGAMIVNAGMG